jgi:hypothetical protein
MVPRACLLIEALADHLAALVVPQKSLLEYVRQTMEHWDPWVSESHSWPSPIQMLLMNGLGNSIRKYPHQWDEVEV